MSSSFDCKKTVFSCGMPLIKVQYTTLTLLALERGLCFVLRRGYIVLLVIPLAENVLVRGNSGYILFISSEWHRVFQLSFDTLTQRSVEMF